MTENDTQQLFWEPGIDTETPQPVKRTRRRRRTWDRLAQKARERRLSMQQKGKAESDA